MRSAAGAFEVDVRLKYPEWFEERIKSEADLG
jgi:hypothetical protein